MATPKTYWLRTDSSAPVLRAYTPGEDFEVVKAVLDALPVETFEPCASCPQQAVCMGSVWVDGLRIGGPEDGPFSEVMSCRYCHLPVLMTFKEGVEKPVSKDCPRRSPKSGDCDACRKVRAEIDRDPVLTPESRLRAEKLLGRVLEDPELAAPWMFVDRAERAASWAAWSRVVGAAIQTGQGPEYVIRVLILEIPDGAMEKAWLARIGRRFTIRVWEGLARAICA